MCDKDSGTLFKAIFGGDDSPSIVGRPRRQASGAQTAVRVGSAQSLTERLATETRQSASLGPVRNRLREVIAASAQNEKIEPDVGRVCPVCTRSFQSIYGLQNHRCRCRAPKTVSTAVSFVLEVHSGHGDIQREIINTRSLVDFTFDDLCQAVRGLVPKADLTKLKWEDAVGTRVKLRNDKNVKAVMEHMHRTKDRNEALKIHVVSRKFGNASLAKECVLNESSDAQSLALKDADAFGTNRKDAQQKVTWQHGDPHAVEYIRNQYKFNGKTFYLVKWRGYEISDDDWEPSQHILKRVIRKFEADLKNNRVVLPRLTRTQEKAARARYDYWAHDFKSIGHRLSSGLDEHSDLFDDGLSEEQHAEIARKAECLRQLTPEQLKNDDSGVQTVSGDDDDNDSDCDIVEHSDSESGRLQIDIDYNDSRANITRDDDEMSIEL